jgi:ribonuclease P protein component
MAGPAPLATLPRRTDFLAAARGRRVGAPSLSLQARLRDPVDTGAPRVGFTCSKKVGNAVARNRAKRRLRAASAAVLASLARPGWDYVLIGLKDQTAERPFPQLLDDLRTALARIHPDADRAR